MEKLVKIILFIAIFFLIETEVFGFRIDYVSIQNKFIVQKNIFWNSSIYSKSVEKFTKKSKQYSKESLVDKVEIEIPLNGNYLYAFPPYPIPANSSVNTMIYWDTKLNINNAEMLVYDINGTKICGKERISLSQLNEYSGIVTWNSAGNKPGVYLLIIAHGTKTVIVKIIIN